MRLWTAWLQGVYHGPSSWPTPAPYVCLHVCMCARVSLHSQGHMSVCVVRGMPFSLRCTLRSCWLGVCQEVRFWMLLTREYNYWLIVYVCVCLYCMSECKMGLLGWVNIDSLCLNRDSPVTFENYFNIWVLAVNCLSINNKGTEVLKVFYVISVKCLCKPAKFCCKPADSSAQLIMVIRFTECVCPHKQGSVFTVGQCTML